MNLAFLSHNSFKTTWFRIQLCFDFAFFRKLLCKLFPSQSCPFVGTLVCLCWRASTWVTAPRISPKLTFLERTEDTMLALNNRTCAFCLQWSQFARWLEAHTEEVKKVSDWSFTPLVEIIFFANSFCENSSLFVLCNFSLKLSQLILLNFTQVCRGVRWVGVKVFKDVRAIPTAAEQTN